MALLSAGLGGPLPPSKLLPTPSRSLQHDTAYAAAAHKPAPARLLTAHAETEGQAGAPIPRRLLHVHLEAAAVFMG